MILRSFAFRSCIRFYDQCSRPGYNLEILSKYDIVSIILRPIEVPRFDVDNPRCYTHPDRMFRGVGIVIRREANLLVIRYVWTNQRGDCRMFWITPTDGGSIDNDPHASGDGTMIDMAVPHDKNHELWGIEVIGVANERDVLCMEV